MKELETNSVRCIVRREMLENGLVNLAAIVGTLLLLINLIPAVLLLTKKSR